MPLNMNPGKGEKRSDFISRCAGNKAVDKEFPDQKQKLAYCYSQWSRKHGKASLVVDTADDQILYGNLELTPEEMVEIEDSTIYSLDALAGVPEGLVEGMEALADSKEPYGKVPYADPGYLPDGKKRYPIDCKHVKAAHSYIGQKRNASQYTSEQLSKIKARINAAYKRCFGEAPPSA